MNKPIEIRNKLKIYPYEFIELHHYLRGFANNVESFEQEYVSIEDIICTEVYYKMSLQKSKWEIENIRPYAKAHRFDLSYSQAATIGKKLVEKCPGHLQTLLDKIHKSLIDNQCFALKNENLLSA